MFFINPLIHLVPLTLPLWSINALYFSKSQTTFLQRLYVSLSSILDTNSLNCFCDSSE